MAKSMKMTDRKDFQERCRRDYTGEKTGADMTDKSKYLAIKYDFEHNHIPLYGDRKKIYDEGKANGW
jgi:hypothetical protein